jgi:putative PIN family toxin of toxin-antitoxin system
LRVFLDTNVLVSAFATRGLCADVLRLVLAEHELIVAEVVLRELRKALRVKLKLPPAIIATIDELLRENEVVPRPRAPSSLEVRDPDDRWVLASAIAGRADLLVTGDGDLLEIAAQSPVRIVDPRGFWVLLRKSPPSR